jgi:hypothetical protein
LANALCEGHGYEFSFPARANAARSSGTNVAHKAGRLTPDPVSLERSGKRAQS